MADGKTGAGRWLFRLGLLGLLAFAAFRAHEWAEQNPQHLPWEPLSVDHPISPLTAWKLDRLRDDFPACRAALDAAGIDYAVLPAVDGGPGCGYADGVRLEHAGVQYASPANVSCVMAIGLRLWEREIVGPAARRHFEAEAERIDTFGTYSCRRIGGGSRGRFSEHASANAIDIAAFRLSDGRRVGIAAHWTGDDAEQGFLRTVRDGACEIFGTTLSPDYNQAHHDHLHFDQTRRGGQTVCR